MLKSMPQVEIDAIDGDAELFAGDVAYTLNKILDVM